MIKVGDHIGVVGLGAMGAPVARHLASAGFSVLGHDRDPSATAALATAGVRPADGLGALTDCAAVLLFVPGDQDVRDAATEYAAQLVTATGPAPYLVICSSVTPATCRVAAEILGDRAVVVDAPLTGGVRGAEAGRINLLTGGDEDAVAALRPVFDTFCATVNHLGPLGSGQVGKTVNNLVHWGEIAVLVEALEFGEALGVPAARMRRALIDGPTDGRTLRELEEFRLTWWSKDLANAFAMAAEARELPVARLVHELMPGITVDRLRAMTNHPTWA
ncbi:MAG: NAD(P)-dependent oxidoreductase, partial [Micromonosporaceae bacterium]|nr:NAD(P)-dependent oxidoreductase [Micromonosporaceae bacterium]